MVTKKIIIRNKQGLHARPAASFVQIANKFGARVTVKHQGEEVNGKAIMNAKPDVVIIATGATPIVPDIPGVKGKNVTLATDVLKGDREVAQNVLIVGGGMVGCETAEFLAVRGKKVTILEMLGRIGADIERANRWVIMARLRSLGIRMERNAKVEEITENGIRVNRDGNSEFFEGDSVVLAVGMESNRNLAHELEEKVVELHVVGDSAKPGKIAQAIENGFQVAQSL
jgi:2,4-dienoyl-CoA reductase (NADPH2)